MLKRRKLKEQIEEKKKEFYHEVKEKSLIWKEGIWYRLKE